MGRTRLVVFCLGASLKRDFRSFLVFYSVHHRWYLNGRFTLKTDAPRSISGASLRKSAYSRMGAWGGVSDFGLFLTSAFLWCFLIESVKKWSFWLQVSIWVSQGWVRFAKYAFSVTVFFGLKCDKLQIILATKIRAFWCRNMRFWSPDFY